MAEVKSSTKELTEVGAPRLYSATGQVCSAPALSQHGEHGIMLHRSGPCGWRGPCFRVGLIDRRAARNQHLHQFSSSPAACPAERRGFEQIIPQVEPGPVIEQ